MTPHELLTTTRSVRRRLDLDRPVARELILDCIDVAVQAPTGGNRQGWQWLVVTEPDRKRFIGERYRQAWYAYNERRVADYEASDPRLARSAQYLADHMSDVPALVIPCIEGRADRTSGASSAAALYGSIIPAAWSFMLAARLHGLGTSYTTLHLHYEEEVAGELGIPYEGFTQAALIPVAYYTGDSFSPAQRIPRERIVHWDSW